MNENETKTQQEPRTKGKKVWMSILNAIINIMIVIVLIVSLLIAVMALTSKSSGISTMFGYTIQTIQSDSMKGTSPDGYEGGDFEHGDLMIAKATSFDPDAVYALGDIVTYRTKDTDGTDMLIVHRIVDVVQKADGTYTYQTQGDNRETSPAPDQIDESEYLYAFDIASVYYSADYQGKVFKGFGSAIDYLRTQQGFFFVVLLPMIIFFMYALIRVVLSATNYKKSKADEEKQSAVEAAVAEALANQNTGAKAAPESMTPEQMEQFKQFLEFQKQQETDKKAEVPETK